MTQLFEKYPDLDIDQLSERLEEIDITLLLKLLDTWSNSAKLIKFTNALDTLIDRLSEYGIGIYLDSWCCSTCGPDFLDSDDVKFYLTSSMQDDCPSHYNSIKPQVSCFAHHLGNGPGKEYIEYIKKEAIDLGFTANIDYEEGYKTWNITLIPTEKILNSDNQDNVKVSSKDLVMRISELNCCPLIDLDQMTNLTV